jgi:hypothetical protein
LLQVAPEYIEVTIAVEHPVERFRSLAGLLGIHLDIVTAFSAAASITLALGVTPDLDRFTSYGATLGRGMTVTGG